MGRGNVDNPFRRLRPCRGPGLDCPHSHSPIRPRRPGRDPSSGLRRPGLAGFAQGVGDHDELAGDGRGDDLVRLPLLPQPIGEDLQVRVADRGDERGLMQDASERPATAADHPLPAHLSAVPRDRRKPRERGGLLSSSVPLVLQFRSGMSRLGFGFDAPRAKPEA